MAIVHFVNYKRGTQSRAAMRGVMLYVMQERKTAWEDGPLISGINCQAQSVYDDFLNTKLLYHKDGGVMFYHMVQSFPKGAAVDPRQAHEAARRLAEYFDGCEVLVCTHVDREHIHSHCVINSVNFETGKKPHMAKEQLQELMRRNDAICQEMGLPVFEPTAQQARGMSGAEYHTALRGQSWKLRLMNTIDECMKYAADRDAFVSLMASEGYAVRWESGRKYITYTTPGGMRCRDNKLHEEMLDLPTPQRTVQRIPTRGEVEKLLDALAKETRHYRLFYLLSMYTGCRRGELSALQWSDFTGTQSGLLLTVSRSRSSVPGKGIVEGSTKNGKSREVYLSSDLRGILLAYKRRKQMEADKQRRKLSPYLFTDEQEQLIHPDTFTKRLRKIYAAIGFPREYHLHTLRHYFVTSLLHCGVDKQTVADLVGHADTGFLERTYCHPQQAQKAQAADSMLTMLRPDGEQIFNLAAACSPKQHST